MNSLNINRYAITAAIAVMLASGFAVPAGAADDTELRTITVKFGDLNVSDPEGAAALYARIHAAARTVCAGPDDVWSRMRAYNCVQKATTEAVNKVNEPALFVAYNQHYKPPLPTALLSQQR